MKTEANIKEVVDSTEGNENDLSILYDKATNIIANAYVKSNYENLKMRWLIGELIADYRIKHNSKYGDGVIDQFSDKLSLKFGKGFSKRNIERMCQFYTKFNIDLISDQYTQEKIASPATQCNKIYISLLINWSHYQELLKIKDENEILYYMQEIINHNLSKEQLRDVIKTKSYQRVICNQTDMIVNEIETKLKDPVILPDTTKKKKRTEKELEQEMVDNLEPFMRDLGSGYNFNSRQRRITINGRNYYVDLVLHNYLLDSFILIDLKIGKVKARDIAQMELYINYYNQYVKENTIGIILCESKDMNIKEYIETKNSDSMYQIQYFTEMPGIEQLEKIIRENKIILLDKPRL